MEGTILLSAGALLFLSDYYYKQKVKQYQKALDDGNAGIDYYKGPTPAPYQNFKNGNLWYEEVRKSGIPPLGMTFGPMGSPNYYFPRPGGHGYYIVNDY